MDAMRALLRIWGLDGFLYGATDFRYAFNYRSNECDDFEKNEITDAYWMDRFEESEPCYDKIEKAIEEAGGFSTIDWRTAEIREYLDRHTEITDYVAIDDRDLREGNNGHAIVTRWCFGKDDFSKAKEILSMHDGPYPLPPEAISPELVSYREKYINPEVFLPNNGYVKGSD